ncbi:MAG TPA: C1 family peptidase [Burkholderiaceae bacterium]|nr:C1 family peptidase [Burkholderiaceae bacterium]
MPSKNVSIGQRRVSLDARPDRLDLRDRPYRPPLGNLPPAFPTDEAVRDLLPAYAAAGLLLNQGEEGACTGFGLAAVINYLLFVRTLNAGGQGIAPAQRVSPAMLYQLARLYDEWPGEDYEGSSCRGALKGWHRHGVCREALWPFVLDKKGRRVYVPPKEDAQLPDDPARNWDVDALGVTLGVYYRVDMRSVVDMQAAIRENGAIYVSANVHEGWAVPARKTLRGHADLGRIKAIAKPKDPGGHAFALVGYNEMGFVVQNSWGPDWGTHGFALLPYEDWVTHGSDAWVFTLGVPRQQAVAAAPAGQAQGKAGARAERTLRSARFLVPSGSGASASAMERPSGLVGADDGLARRYSGLKNAANRPLDSDAAYRHAIVLDRGFPVKNDITAENAATALEAAALTRPLAWMKAQGSDKLLVYAHGGLNSETDSIARIRTIAPYALNNGLYPLFVTWRTGPLETLNDLVEESMAKFGLAERGVTPQRGWLDRVSDTTDRLLEPLLRAPGGAMWGQMKLNAERAGNHEQGGVRLAVQHLKALKAARPKLEIHLVGHSAGSIVLGAMLGQMRAAGLKAASVRLFAPACTARFALDHYVPAVQDGVLDKRHFHLHLLSDRNERGDSVGPYRKSLLYLVSRSFEDVHKMPLLGMEHCFLEKSVDAAAADGIWAASHIGDAARWFEFWQQLGTGERCLHLLKEPSVSDGVRALRASHGCFDNAVKIVGEALAYAVDPAAPPKITIERLDY